MAADVPLQQPAPLPAGEPAAGRGPHMADYSLHPTRAEKDGYYIYDDEVNMQALAGISLPIAVQCEKLLEKRYSLFDYIVRAVVRACTSTPEWAPERVDTMLFERCGENTSAIPDSAGKTIYHIACATRADTPPPPHYHPHIVVCDAFTTRAQVAEQLSSDNRPDFAFVARGGTPKVGIRVGREEVHNYLLPYTFYASTKAIPPAVANRIAAELHALLFNPVRLLLLT